MCQSYVAFRDWRYIRYADGGEELYDHRSDPHEWTNLADAPEFAAVKAELANYLPQTDAPSRRKANKKQAGTSTRKETTTDSRSSAQPVSDEFRRW